mmetsp:Transcript_51151/g.61578  ORF Transcript_51151/g.61578 Transcript_51151/m.61578 type:complete len:243 (+) Transcript_51151:430-1158(+)
MGLPPVSCFGNHRVIVSVGGVVGHVLAQIALHGVTHKGWVGLELKPHRIGNPAAYQIIGQYQVHNQLKPRIVHNDIHPYFRVTTITTRSVIFLRFGSSIDQFLEVGGQGSGIIVQQVIIGRSEDLGKHGGSYDGIGRPDAQIHFVPPQRKRRCQPQPLFDIPSRSCSAFHQVGCHLGEDGCGHGHGGDQPGGFLMEEGIVANGGGIAVAIVEIPQRFQEAAIDVKFGHHPRSRQPRVHFPLF